MQRDRMQAENQKQQAERSDELTMITATESADDRDGLWDGQNGELLESGVDPQAAEQMRHALQLPEQDDEVVSMEDAQVSTQPSRMVRNDGPRMGPLGVPIDPQAVEQERDEIEIAQADYTSARPNVEIQRVERPDRRRIIRVNSDLDPTIGQGPGSQWHFKKGRRYEVPEHVAFHLHEKGYVSSWG